MKKFVIKKCIVSLFIALIFLNPIKSQDKKSDKNLSILPVPAIGFSPETKTYIGAVTLFTFKNPGDSLSRTSNAKVEFNYTWNKQIIVESGWNYFSPQEKWFTRGLIHYSKYPDLYYGIGANTPKSNEVNFQSNRIIFDVDVLKNLRKKRFLGLGINYRNYGNIEYAEEELYFPELKNEAVYGLRILFLKDNRNNILSSSKGNYIEISNSFNFYSSLYSVTRIDLRKYLSFGKNDKQTLAGRFYHTSVFGEPPFFDYPVIGGDKYVRGYYLGRFRDKNLSSLQFEYRNLLFWRIGIATFGGISMMYKNFGKIQEESFKPNAGVGLRFLVDKNENTNLRIDYALGANNQSGFYISFGESF